MNKEVELIYNDINNIDFIGKNVLNKKYNVNFSREYELIHYLYGLCIDIRKKTYNYEYSKEDYSIFNCYWDTPCSSKKLFEAIKDENVSFIEFILSFYKENSKRCHKDKRYSTLLKILDKIKNQFLEHDLFNKMIELTKDYKKYYIDSYIDFYIEKMFFYKEYLNKDISKKSNKFQSQFNFIKYDSDNFNEDFYRKKLKVSAENQYIHNMDLLVDRMIKKTPNPNNIELEYISKDYIGFEVVLHSDDFKMHIRAIYCAENSDLVSPHLRYICTKVKNN